MQTEPPESNRPRIRPRRRIALMAATSLAAGSLVLASSLWAQAQTPEPTPTDTHTTPPATPTPTTPSPTHTTTSPTPTHSTTSPTPTHTTPSPSAPSPSTSSAQPPSVAPPPPPPTTPTHPAQPQQETCATHTIVSGDTLWDIAGKSLGDPKRWPEIYDVNRAVIEAAAREHPGPPVLGSSDHGHWIFPGFHIQIPGTACPATQPAQPSTPGVGVLRDCSKPLVIGVRGSGEEGLPHQGLTTTRDLGIFGGAIADGLKSSGALAYGLPYPAASVPELVQNDVDKLIRKHWLDALAGGPGAARIAADLKENGFPVPDSVERGAEGLEMDIVNRVTACPNQKILLTGYSQGAWVIRLALDRLQHRTEKPDWETIRSKIAGIGLLADPFNDFFKPELPPDVVGRTLKICDSEDPVCNDLTKTPRNERCLSDPPTILCPHFRYGTEVAAGTGGKTGVQAITDFLRRKL